ncbi:MAG: AAA family ATPase [Gammaproteobacteria bacterium]|nr:AAA family ATPase [Gammaproteobacteria bacterium]
MNVKIICVCHQKGGAGKSTVTMQLAGTLSLRNYKTLVVDADPQGTSMRWSASALDDKLFPAQVVGMGVAGAKIHREVKKFAFDYDLIIIDCPPAIESPVSESALLISDLALVPCIPSPPDIWAANGIAGLIERISGVNEGLKARIIINQIKEKTLLGKEVKDLLDNFGIKLAKTQLRQREVYRHSALYGTTVHHFGKQATEAITEIEALADETCTILGLPHAKA